MYITLHRRTIKRMKMSTKRQKNTYMGRKDLKLKKRVEQAIDADARKDIQRYRETASSNERVASAKGQLQETAKKKKKPVR